MKHKPLIILIVLLLLFGVPLLGAFFMAQEKITLTSHTVNRGELIQPPQDFAKLNLHHTNGTSVAADEWEGKWLMVYVNTNKVCDTSCQKKLYDMRQVRTATGKDQSRVERVILTLSDAPPDPQLAKALSTDFADTLHFVIFRKNLTLSGGSIYMVDPLGNIMMKYPPNTDPMGMLKDLTRLLKLSHIG